MCGEGDKWLAAPPKTHACSSCEQHRRLLLDPHLALTAICPESGEAGSGNPSYASPWAASSSIGGSAGNLVDMTGLARDPLTRSWTTRMVARTLDFLRSDADRTTSSAEDFTGHLCVIALSGHHVPQAFFCSRVVELGVMIIPLISFFNTVFFYKAAASHQLRLVQNLQGTLILFTNQTGRAPVSQASAAERYGTYTIAANGLGVVRCSNRVLSPQPGLMSEQVLNNEL